MATTINQNTLDRTDVSGARIESELPTLFQSIFEENLRNTVPFRMLVTFSTIPVGSGADNKSFPFLSDFDIVDDSLAEGVQPNQQKVERTKITVTSQDFGVRVSITRNLMRETIHRSVLIAELVSRLSEVASQTENKKIHDVVVAGTNVFFSGTATAKVNVSANIAKTDLDDALEKFLENNIRPWNTSPIRTGPNTDTFNIREGYILFVNAAGKRRLEGFDGFIPTANYANAVDVLPYEFGSIGEFRLIFTNTVENDTGAGSGGADLMRVLAFGRDGIVGTYFEGDYQRLIFHGFGSGIGEDFANLFTHLVWVGNFGFSLKRPLASAVIYGKA